MNSKNRMKKTHLCYIFREEFEDTYAKEKKYCKVRDHFYYTGEYRGAENSICNLKYSIPEENFITFCNASNFDYILS